jgi:EmrB/QacA subfamily drug resistance transporter
MGWEHDSWFGNFPNHNTRTFFCGLIAEFTMETTNNRKWLILAAVGMGIFLATIDGSIVNVALPTLVEELGTDFTTVQWVVLAYLLTVTTLMLGIGRLADMKGKKPIYTTGFIVFTIGSLLCGLAANIYLLIGSRVLQAVGAAMTMALGMAIVTEAFPASERGKALGITGAIVSIGIVLGPTIGGLILGILPWNWIFYVNLPIGILGIYLVIRFVPSTIPPGGQRFDFWGAALLFVSLLSLLLALSFAQSSGFLSPIVFSLLLAFAGFIFLFIWLELRIEQPMIDLPLFSNLLFSTSLATGFITFIATAGTILLMPFYLENVLGYTPRQVGLLLAVVPLATGVIAPISGSLSDRFGSRRITVLGLSILVLGFMAVSTLDAQTSALGYVLRFLPVGIGLGVFQSPNNSAIMGAAPRHRLGIASGMLAVNRTLGQTTGIAVLGALWSRFVFSAASSDQAILTAGVTAAPPEAQVAGLQKTFFIVIGLMLVALCLAIWALRQERRGVTLQNPQ